MVQICLFLQAREGKDARENDIAEEVAQLRRQIKKLTKLAHRHDKWDLESLPSTFIRSLDIAIALDNSASGKADDSSSGFRSSGTEEPIERVKKWVQDSHMWQPPSSKPSSQNRMPVSETSTISSHSRASSSRTVGRASSTKSLNRITREIDSLQLSGEGRYASLLRKIPQLLEKGDVEPAKSICRQVIHGTELEFGIKHHSYKEALRILAMIYDHGGDDDEAAQLRMLLSTPGINDMRKEFKSRLKNSSPKECIEYAFGWAVLL